MVAMMGLATSSGIATTTITDFNRSTKSADKLVSESKTQNQDVKQTNQFSNQEKRTFKRTNSSAQKFVSNYGIDPKTYGMYYVKARTHKRTNV